MTSACLRTNIPAIVSAGFAGFAFSLVWYSPFVFGNVRLTASGEEAASMPLWKMLVAPLREIVSAYVLAVLISGLGIADWRRAAGLGLFLWFGFYVVQLAGAVIWDGMSLALGAVHAGDWLVKMLAMAVIVVLWPKPARGRDASIVA